MPKYDARVMKRSEARNVYVFDAISNEKIIGVIACDTDEGWLVFHRNGERTYDRPFYVIDNVKIDNVKVEITFSASKDYPHKCNRCGGPAFVGFSSVDCKRKCS